MKERVFTKHPMAGRGMGYMYLAISVLGGLTIFLGSGRLPSFMALFFVLGIIFIVSSQEVLFFHSDHFVFKPAPLATTYRVLYADVVSVELAPKKIVLQLAGGKRVKVKKGLFTAADWAEVTKCFNQLNGLINGK